LVSGGEGERLAAGRVGRPGAGNRPIRETSPAIEPSTVLAGREVAGVQDAGERIDRDPKGVEVPDEQFAAINIHRDDFHAERNYTIKSSPTEE
jgi:hypothetical protein